VLRELEKNAQNGIPMLLQNLKFAACPRQIDG